MLGEHEVLLRQTLLKYHIILNASVMCC